MTLAGILICASLLSELAAPGAAGAGAAESAAVSPQGAGAEGSASVSPRGAKAPEGEKSAEPAQAPRNHARQPNGLKREPGAKAATGKAVASPEPAAKGALEAQGAAGSAAVSPRGAGAAGSAAVSPQGAKAPEGDKGAEPAQAPRNHARQPNALTREPGAEGALEAQGAAGSAAVSPRGAKALEGEKSEEPAQAPRNHARQPDALKREPGAEGALEAQGAAGSAAVSPQGAKAPEGEKSAETAQAPRNHARQPDALKREPAPTGAEAKSATAATKPATAATKPATAATKPATAASEGAEAKPATAAVKAKSAGADEKRTVRITSGSANYDRKEGVITFNKDVFVDDEEYKMHADQLYVFLDGTNDLKRIVAIGNVAITNDTKVGQCAKAAYTKDISKIVMYSDGEKNASIADFGKRSNTVTGKKITFWINEERVLVDDSLITLDTTSVGSGNLKDMMGK